MLGRTYFPPTIRKEEPRQPMKLDGALPGRATRFRDVHRPILSTPQSGHCFGTVIADQNGLNSSIEYLRLGSMHCVPDSLFRAGGTRILKDGIF
jgi:hypothetical protein